MASLQIGELAELAGVTAPTVRYYESIGLLKKPARSGKRPCERVIDLAKTHLAEVDDQLRRLAAFREQLAAELARWEGPRDTDCDGLCQMIESSNPAPDSEPRALRPKGRTSRIGVR
jgi:DNA-binding transcriptional MerR regulator